MARGDFPSNKQDQFMVRFPDGMRDRIRESAENLGRSMNSEIVQRLANSFDDDQEGDRLRLDLPGDVWNALIMDAALHNRSEEEHAAELLRGVFTEGGIVDGPTDYARALDKISELTNDLADEVDRNIDLREKLDYDFILYFNKVVQLDQFVNTILRQPEERISSDIRKMARELAAVAEVEISIFQERHKYAEYHKRRKEGALLNSENADGIGKGVENVTYAEIEEYTPAMLAEVWGVPEVLLPILVKLDALWVRRTGTGKFDFMVPRSIADRFARTGTGKSILDSIHSAMQKIGDVDQAAPETRSK